MTGAEYLTAAVLQALWAELDEAFRSELAESETSLQSFLQRRSSAWNLVGRVHFNLAENRRTMRRRSRFSPPTRRSCRRRRGRSTCRSGAR